MMTEQVSTGRATLRTLMTAALLVMFSMSMAVAQATLVVNPYEGIDWETTGHFRTNLHCHTTESDGRMDPPVVIDEYHQRGYDALAITDHNLCTWPWEDFGRSPEELGMVAIPGNELSRHHHALSLFAEFEHPSRDIDEVMDALAEADGLGVLCHPALHWNREYGYAPGLQMEMRPTLREVTRGDFTIEAWFRTTDQRRHILIGNYSPDDRGALNLELHRENHVRLYAQPTEGTTLDMNLSADELDIDTRDGEWHHLAGVRRGDTAQLFLDGQLLGEVEDPAGAYDLHGDAYFIARDHRRGGTILIGDLDHVRLWTRALSAEEIAQLHDGAVPDADAAPSSEGLLLQHTFEALDEAGFADTAGHAGGPFHAAILTPETTPEQVEEVPQALEREGVSTGSLRFATPPVMDHVPDEAMEGYGYVELFQRHPHLVGLEVTNEGRPAGEYGLDRQLWDRILTELMPERPVWGFANDDMHSIGRLGSDWMTFFAPEANLESLRRATETGAFSSSTIRLRTGEGTPRIEEITHDAGAGIITIRATIDGEAATDEAYRWISDGEVVQVGPTLSYREVEGIGSYARAEIETEGGLTLTNPFGFETQR